jgi:general secretion pathway protein E
MATRHPLPYAFAKANTVLLEDDGEHLVLWAGENTPTSALAEVTRLFDVARFEREAASTLGQRIASAYSGGEGSAAAVIGEVESGVDLSRMMQDLPAVEDLLEAADDAPIIRMLNALLTQAAKDGASDIHIEPYERSSSVRFRVDGTLREVVQPNRALHAALISRLKIMAELDIAEKRLPQDGRISLRIGGRAIDVRVSTLPSAHGERAVLRLLDKTESKFTLESLGMNGDVLSSFQRLIHQPHGIVLVTGPTGSGKTTTLYASLQRIDTATTNVLTVEDPIEYELPGIGQTQVNPKIDLTFAKALRAILRQDPDVIMVGEIRDFETAQIAIQASLTGHLVLATVHTNDAISSVTRLIDMGVEPFLLSSSLLGSLAQRLVRKLCPHCKARGSDGHWHPVGCPRCGQTGYKGRTGVYELMVADEKVRSLIHKRAPENKLFLVAEAAGLRPMGEDGQRLVDEGITSREEVLRVTGESVEMGLAGTETSRFGDAVTATTALRGARPR